MKLRRLEKGCDFNINFKIYSDLSIGFIPACGRQAVKKLVGLFFVFSFICVFVVISYFEEEAWLKNI